MTDQDLRATYHQLLRDRRMVASRLGRARDRVAAAQREAQALAETHGQLADQADALLRAHPWLENPGGA